MKAGFAALVFVFAYASSVQAQKDSMLVYETTTRSTVLISVMGESSERTRTVESALGVRQELIFATGQVTAGIAGNPFGKNPGSYTLTLASGAMYFVDPVAREYSSISDILGEGHKDTTKVLEAIKAFADNVDSNSQSDVDSVGAGDVIAGRPTSHWKIHEIKRIAMKTGDDSVITGSDLTTDAYFAQSISRLAPKAIRDSKFGREAVKKLPETLELRSITKGNMSIPGMPVPIQISKEVTQVSMRALDRTQFEIPRSYKKVEMQFSASPRMNF